LEDPVADARLVSSTFAVRSEYYGPTQSGPAFTLQPGGGAELGLTDTIAVRLQIDVRTIFAPYGRSNAIRVGPGS
jgi:hypothetical protein